MSQVSLRGRHGDGSNSAMDFVLQLSHRSRARSHVNTETGRSCVQNVPAVGVSSGVSIGALKKLTDPVLVLRIGCWRATLLASVDLVYWLRWHGDSEKLRGSPQPMLPRECVPIVRDRFHSRSTKKFSCKEAAPSHGVEESHLCLRRWSRQRWFQEIWRCLLEFCIVDSWGLFVISFNLGVLCVKYRVSCGFQSVRCVSTCCSLPYECMGTWYLSKKSALEYHL